eukprot:1156961-Pelagomonas_calceolata.AAC.8
MEWACQADLSASQPSRPPMKRASTSTLSLSIARPISAFMCAPNSWSFVVCADHGGLHVCKVGQFRTPTAHLLYIQCCKLRFPADYGGFMKAVPTLNECAPMRRRADELFTRAQWNAAMR